MSLKQFKYAIDDTVKVNEKSKLGVPNYAGRIGHIYSQLVAGSYDYEVQFDKHTRGKFLESELDEYFGGEFETSRNIDNGIELQKEEIQLLADEVLNVFLKQYENDNYTYIVPKELLFNLIELANKGVK